MFENDFYEPIIPDDVVINPCCDCDRFDYINKKCRCPSKNNCVLGCYELDRDE